jgi:hypothetical protein
VSVEEFASLRDVRRALRQLPRERRKDVLAAIRAGRAVNDRRDAVLAVAWAERLSKVRWPAWVMPRARPHGMRRWLWLLPSYPQILAVLDGSGNVSGPTGVEEPIEAGEAVFWQGGEEHETNEGDELEMFQKPM